MTDYRHMAKEFLNENRPKKLKEMKDAGTLDAFLDEIQEFFSAREVETVQKLLKGLPMEASYLQAAQAAEAVKRGTAEILIDLLRNLLSLEPSEAEETSDVLKRERLDPRPPRRS